MQVVFALFIALNLLFSQQSIAQSTVYAVDSDLPQYVSLDKNYELDLNEDGIKEQIFYGHKDFRVNGESYYNTVEYSVYANNPIESTFLFLDLNTEDHQKEIGLMVDGPSGDPALYLFSYDGATLIELGVIPCDFTNKSEAFDGRGTITGTKRCNVLETSWLNTQWRLEADNRIHQIMQSLYTIVQYDREIPIILNQPISLFVEPSLNADTIMIQPQKVRYIGTDDIAWFQIVGEDGTTGWQVTERYDYLPTIKASTDKVFSNLYRAD